MTIFVMDEPTATKLRALADYAAQNRYDLSTMRQRHEDTKKGLAIEPVPEQFHATLPMEFRVVYTVEEHPNPDGGGMWFRHLSMSSPRRGRVPVEPALEWVMANLGYRGRIKECIGWMEDIGPDHVAVNVLEPFEEVQVATSMTS